MNRHRLLWALLIATVVCLLQLAVFAGEARDEAASQRRPNIVLLVADDMGYSDAGCFGGEIQTPNIDRLAAGGLRFTHFYNNALCGPTRASLLTGLYCQQAGLPGHRWTGPRDYQRCLTIGEVLQAAGYHTMLAGKWQDAQVANHHGFDRYFGMKARVPISYFHEITLDPYFLDHQQVHPPDGFFLTDLLTDYMVTFVDEAVKRDQPFFLYAPYVAPHWPLHAREEDIAKYREKYMGTGWDEWRARRYRRQVEMGVVGKDSQLSPRPQHIHAWDDDPNRRWQAERMATYAAQIDCLDRNIGRVLQALERAGEMENTLILFLSDNGAAQDGGNEPTQEPFSPIVQRRDWRLDAKQMRAGSSLAVMPGPADTFSAYGPAWANLSNTPYRDYKWSTYEGGIITPLIVHWPDVIKPSGRITHQVGHVMDIMATCLDVAGVEYPTKFAGRRPLPIQGKSLAPVFLGRERAGHEEMYWFVGGRALRMGSWKMVSANTRSSWELYDVVEDPTELNDLAKAEPQRVEQMVARYTAWAERVGITRFAFPEGN